MFFLRHHFLLKLVKFHHAVVDVVSLPMILVKTRGPRRIYRMNTHGPNYIFISLRKVFTLFLQSICILFL